MVFRTPSRRCFAPPSRQAEQAGKLDHVLERLADYVESRQPDARKIMLATFYPAILTVVAISVVILLMTYVVPKVVNVFDSIHAELPPLTRGLIAFSGFLRDYGIYLAIAIVLGVIAFSRAVCARMISGARWIRACSSCR